MLDSGLDELKTWLELLGREAPTLLSLGCPTIASNFAGIEQQTKVAKDLGYPVCQLWFGKLDSRYDKGYTIKSFPVELKHAVTLIKTMKKRMK